LNDQKILAGLIELDIRSLKDRLLREGFLLF